MKSPFSLGRVLDGRRMPQTAVETLTMRWRYFLASCWCALSGIANGLPVPPPRLTWLVADHFMVVRSLRNGIRSAEQIRETLARNRLRIDDFPELLDFGCGSGRVLRNWRTLKTTCVYGTDYNSEMIRWCRTHLRFAHFSFVCSSHSSVSTATGMQDITFFRRLISPMDVPEHAFL